MNVVFLLFFFACATHALPPLNMRLNVTDIGTLPPLQVRFNLTAVPTAKHTMTMPPMNVHVGFNRTLPVNVAFTTLEIPTIQFHPLQVATDPITLNAASFRPLISSLAKMLIVAALAWHAAKWMFISLLRGCRYDEIGNRRLLLNDSVEKCVDAKRSWVAFFISFLGLATSAILAVVYV